MRGSWKTYLLTAVFSGLGLTPTQVWGADLELLDGNKVVLRLAPNATKATGTLRIKNAGQNDVKLNLRAAGWTSALRGVLEGVTAEFKEAPGGQTPGSLGKGESKEISLEVSGIASPGVSSAKLRNGPEEIGAIEVEKLDFPLPVKLDPAAQEILFTHGHGGAIHLINEADHICPVSWKLDVAGRSYQGTVTLPAGGIQKVGVDTGGTEPFGRWSWLDGLLRDDIQEGVLSLTFQPRSGAEIPLGSPGRVVRAKARLRYYASLGIFLNDVTLVLILFAGAFASAFVKIWLPNTRKRLKLKESLSRLVRQMNDISTRLGVRPLVVLRVQQKRLDDMLNAPFKAHWRSPFKPLNENAGRFRWPIEIEKRPGTRWAWSPDFGDLLKECEAATGRLTKQVTLLLSLDQSANRLASQMGTQAPPSLIADIENRVSRVVNLVLPLEASDQDLELLTAEVKKVDDCIDGLEERKTDFRTEVQLRLEELRVYYSLLVGLEGVEPEATEDACRGPVLLKQAAQKFCRDLPTPFEALKLKEVPEQVTFETLSDLDADLFKLALIRRYLDLNPQLEQAEPKLNTPEAAYPLLVEHLKLRSWDALRSAVRIVLEGEQGLYGEDVMEALRKPGESLDLWRDRLDVRPNTPVEFAVQFRRASLNRAAAREQFLCRWSFIHPNQKCYDLMDRCWRVSRYFPVEGTYKIKVQFEKETGEPIEGGVREEELTITSRSFATVGPRLRVEMVSAFLALAPAVFGLLGAAQREVAKLEWYMAVGAVFVLGFGVDTIRTLITDRQP